MLAAGHLCIGAGYPILREPKSVREEPTISSASQTAETILQRHGWIFLFVLEILLALNILLVIAIAEGPEDFEADTGVAWAEFSEAYPTVATAFKLEQRVAFTGYLGLTLFALGITFFAFRNGLRWAWYTMWILPGVLAVTAALFVPSDQPNLATYYGGFAGVAVIGLLLPIRKFFPKSA